MVRKMEMKMMREEECCRRWYAKAKMEVVSRILHPFTKAGCVVGLRYQVHTYVPLCSWGR